MSSEFKSDIPTLVQLSWMGRIAQIRPWFWFLLAAGVGAAGVSIWRAVPFSEEPGSPGDESAVHAPTVFASVDFVAFLPQGEPQETFPDNRFLPYVLPGIYVLLGFVLIMSLGVTLLSEDAAKVVIASDLLKTVLGFFIGAASGISLAA